MIFKFLEKPVNIDCFIMEENSFINTANPIVPASKFIPSWWKNTPNSYFDWEKVQAVRTTKSCGGIIGTFKNGFIQPLWSDLAVKVTEERCHVVFSDEKTHSHFHSSYQFPNFYDEHYTLKIQSPWIMKFSENIKIALLDPFYLYNKPRPYFTPYGISELYDKFFNPNVFLMFPNIQNNIMIKSGTPLIHILPVTDKKVTMKTHVVDRNEFLKYDSYANSMVSSVFINRNRILNKFRKMYIDMWKD